MKNAKPTSINTSPLGVGGASRNTSSLGAGGLSSRHLAFARHYLKGCTQAEAYLKVYGGSHANAKSRGSDLCKRNDIAAYLAQHHLADYEDTEAELEVHARQKKLDIDTRRELLAAIALGERTYNRHYNVKGELITKTDELPPNALLRAIELDAKLEAGWYDRKPMPKLTPEEKQQQKEMEKKKKEEEERKKAQRFKTLIYYQGTKCYNPKFQDLTPLEEKALWQLSLKHEAIDAAAIPLEDKYLDCGCVTKRNMDTGIFYIECPGGAEYENIPDKSPKVTDEDLQPLDEQQLADIVENNPMIAAAINNEHTIVLRPGNRNKEEPGKLSSELEAAKKNNEDPITLPLPVRTGTGGLDNEGIGWS